METFTDRFKVKTVFEDANNYMKDGVLLRQVLCVIDELDLGDYEESHAFGDIYESILKELQSAGSSGEFYTPRAVTEFMAERINPKLGETVADFACGTGGFLTSWLKQLEDKTNSAEDVLKYSSSIYGIEKKPFPYTLCITNMLLHGIDVPRIYHDNSLQYDVLNYTDDDRFDVILMNPPYGGNEKSDIKSHFPSDLASSETADNPATKETWFYRLDMPEGYKHFSKTKPMKIEHFEEARIWWENRQEIEEDGFPKAKKYTNKELTDLGYNIDLCGYPHEEEEILAPKDLIARYEEKRASLNAEIDSVLADITRILGE